MAMLVVLFESDEGEVLLGSRAVTRLARLGVTSVALLSDDRTICVVLEGWAFIRRDHPVTSCRLSRPLPARRGRSSPPCRSP